MPRKKHKDARDWIYSPEGFDAGRFDIPSGLEVHVRWLLNCIYFNRVLTNREVEDWVPLHSDLLADVMGRRNLVAKVRQLCLDAGLIEIDGGLKNYKPGVQSLRYRLGPALAGVTFRKWSVAGTRFAQRVAAFRNHASNSEDLDEIGMHLKGWVERVSFLDNLVEVLAGIEDSKPTRKNKLVNPDAKRILARHQVEVISECRVIRAMRDEFGRRFHSNLTGLVSDVRKNCLTFDGVNPLVEIDIANSQPYQLACLLCEKNQESDNQHTHSTQTQETSPINPTNTSDVYHNVPRKGSIEEFCLDVCEARLYQRMVDEFGVKSIGKAKTHFFWEVYSEDSPMPCCWTLYPEVARAVLTWKEDRGHLTIPQDMQRLESAAMIDGVCGRLVADHPDVPVITCHDSILCREEDVDLMLDLIEAAHSSNPFPPSVRINGELIAQECVL